MKDGAAINQMLKERVSKRGDYLKILKGRSGWQKEKRFVW